jgi:hypothetical protein
LLSKGGRGPERHFEIYIVCAIDVVASFRITEMLFGLYVP